MKKYLLLFLLPCIALAQLAPLPAPPDYISLVLANLGALPKVGPYLVLLAKWSGFVIVGLTTLSSLLMALEQACTQLGKSAWLSKLTMVGTFISSLLPWVKILSVYNADLPKPLATLKQKFTQKGVTK
jgi:hypothetical protein